MNAREQGLFHKFNVSRVDGSDQPGGKHHGAEYFVLDLTTDKHAWPAIAAYAESCAAEYPALAADLLAKLIEHTGVLSEFVTVPETTLPDGTMVPAFQVMRYLAAQGPGGTPLSVPDAAPWVEISYHEARAAAERAGMRLLTETQALSIAWNASQQDANWSGGKVGEGSLFQGLHKGMVGAAQPGAYVSTDAEEQRWFVLSNGERLCDVAGNAYSWIFDDVQGDENGLVKGRIQADSISLRAPFVPKEKGMGWRPSGSANWSGYALIRGGYWCSEASAGAFNLYYYWPGNRYDGVGFRCTKGL